MTEKENELLDVLENLCRHHLHHNGKDVVACFTAESDALEALAEANRFVITKKYGRTRTGRWADDVDKPKQGEQ
jgi:fructosamine-3-kinase